MLFVQCLRICELALLAIALSAIKNWMQASSRACSAAVQTTVAGV